ncbi:hypothetical protein GALMADRAFT_141469 [Galerina marginata CBS 339.88]|uniref:Uncharacterized protein n=1 Tax=Galerina marginata (strain CBS 339.88) TaxID=685588 RepID=A0A067SU93_GALM3|nr:hypothetical protein GALMADRAFT_141469 [Galerina marginata CBS 339.88]
MSFKKRTRPRPSSLAAFAATLVSFLVKACLPFIVEPMLEDGTRATPQQGAYTAADTAISHRESRTLSLSSPSLACPSVQVLSDSPTPSPVPFNVAWNKRLYPLAARADSSLLTGKRSALPLTRPSQFVPAAHVFNIASKGANSTTFGS